MGQGREEAEELNVRSGRKREIRENEKGYKEKYAGMYIAVKSFQGKDVVSSGSDPVMVVNNAIRRGIKEPHILATSGEFS